MKKINMALLVAFLLILVGFIFIGVSEYKKVDYGFVNTEKLLNCTVHLLLCLSDRERLMSA